MSEFVFEIDTEAAESAGGSGGKFGVLDTGMYDVEITTASMGKTKSGNNKIDISLKVLADGHETTIYQAFVIDKLWATGSENHGYKDWQAFVTVAGMKSLTVFPKTIVDDSSKPILKNGQPIVLNAIKELERKQLTMAIVKEFDFYNSEVDEGNEIYATFRTNSKLNAREILTGETEAKVYDKLKDRLADKYSKRYKAYQASGAAEDTSGDAPVEDEDLGL